MSATIATTSIQGADDEWYGRCNQIPILAGDAGRLATWWLCGGVGQTRAV